MHVTDAQLLERFLRNRDEAAFQMIVERHVPMVLAMARRVARDEEIARDVCQQCFIRLSERASTVRKDAGIVAWLHMTARSLAIDAVRSEKRRKAREIKSVEAMEFDHADNARWKELAPTLDELMGRPPRKTAR